MLRNARVPILGFVTFSNVGKTTLLVKLLPLLNARGLRIGTLKHAPHGFDIDHPGKDSYALRQAGAKQILIGSKQHWALVSETDRHHALTLDELLLRLDQDALDCVLVEGFKHERYPKIELHRPTLGHPLLCVDDRSVIAVATDAPLTAHTDLPLLNLNDAGEIAEFVCETLFQDDTKYVPKAR